MQNTGLIYHWKERYILLTVLRKPISQCWIILFRVYPIISDYNLRFYFQNWFCLSTLCPAKWGNSCSSFATGKNVAKYCRALQFWPHMTSDTHLSYRTREDIWGVLSFDQFYLSKINNSPLFLSKIESSAKCAKHFLRQKYTTPTYLFFLQQTEDVKYKRSKGKPGGPSGVFFSNLLLDEHSSLCSRRRVDMQVCMWPPLPPPSPVIVSDSSVSAGRGWQRQVDNKRWSVLISVVDPDP
jgi:hypothetical protein